LGKIKNDNMSENEFIDFLYKNFNLMSDYLKPLGCFIDTCEIYLMLDNSKSFGFYLMIVWHKELVIGDLNKTDFYLIMKWFSI
jgi:hypothetical protein